MNQAGISEPDRRWLRRAVATLRHRGPDAEGEWAGARAALGHRRLSIIDLTSGAQPMADAAGRRVITYNGEIYNYRELRVELQGRGCVFRTQSDTEVILHAYAAWGVDCLERFNGIFAFGLWDEEEQTLLLARDHLGVKPLLYYQDREGCLFASELKVLLAHPRVPRELDPAAVSDYLSLSYILAPRTIVRAVRKLEPASWLRWRRGETVIRRYWDLAAAVRAAAEPGRTEPQAVEQLHAELDRSVRLQLVSDVPLGAFLSGGVDSSTIVQKMTEQAAGRVRTFSIGFRERSYSELPYARRVAASLGTEATEEIVTPNLAELMPRLAWYYDEPYAETSAVPTYLLCRLAARHVKVALSGDGGDECFAGYETYVADRFQQLYRRLPGWLHRGLLLPLANHLPATHRKVSWDYKIKQFVREARAAPEVAHYRWRQVFAEEEKAELWGDAAPAGLDGHTPEGAFLHHYDEIPDASFLQRSQYVDIKTWLADAMLVKVDRASMANGLEVRVPLLDRRLVVWALALPDNLRLRGRRTKYILKHTMAGRLPPGIAWRAKRGFNAPAAHWVKTWADALRGHECDILPGFGRVAERLLAEHAAHRADHGFRLWVMLNWVLWKQQVWDQVHAEPGER